MLVLLTLIGLMLCLMPISAQQEAPEEPAISAENASSLIKLVVLEGHTMAVMGLAFSPDSRLLVSASDDVSLRVWNIGEQMLMAEIFPHASFTRGVAFSPNGTLLASVSWDRTVVIHNIENDRPVERNISTPFPAIIDRVVFHPDGERLAFGVGDGRVHLTDTLDLTGGRTFRLPALQITALAFSPDGHVLAAAGGFPEDSVWLWNIEADAPESTSVVLTGHRGSVLDIAFAPPAEDHQILLLASASDDGTVRLWTVSETASQINAEEVAILNAGSSDDWMTAVAFSTNGSLLAVGSLESGTLLWDVRDPEAPVLVIALPDYDDGINAVAFSPDGHFLATAGQNGIVRVWSLPPE